MGGSGGGSRNYSRDLVGSGKKVNDDECSNVNFLTKLQMIQPNAVNYSVDDALMVEDLNGNIVATGKHGICGYITSLDVIKLIECMKKGFSFKATVINITSTSCEVRVRSLIK